MVPTVILYAVTIEMLARANGQGKHLIHAREKNIDAPILNTSFLPAKRITTEQMAWRRFPTVFLAQ